MRVVEGGIGRHRAHPAVTGPILRRKDDGAVCCDTDGGDESEATVCTMRITAQRYGLTVVYVVLVVTEDSQHHSIVSHTRLYNLYNDIVIVATDWDHPTK